MVIFNPTFTSDLRGVQTIMIALDCSTDCINGSTTPAGHNDRDNEELRSLVVLFEC